MGRIVDSYEFHNQELNDSGKLIIFCNNSSKSSERTSLNVALAKKLKSASLNKRTLFMEKYVAALIPEDGNAVIADFDVMFNPNYKIDVLRIMTSIFKYKHFSISWPGKLVDQQLTYAEPGDADYVSYDINGYDIICVR